MEPGTTPADAIIQQLNSGTMAKLKILFRNAHALSEAGHIYTDFVWLAELDRVKGLDIGHTYINGLGDRQFTNAIAEIEIEGISVSAIKE